MEWLRGAPVQCRGETVGKVEKVYKGGDGELLCEMHIDDDDVKEELFEAARKVTAHANATMSFGMSEDERAVHITASEYRKYLWSKTQVRGVVARDPETDPEKVQRLAQELVERELMVPGCACMSRQDPAPEPLDTQVTKLKLEDA
jgi:hypothetical protein